MRVPSAQMKKPFGVLEKQNPWSSQLQSRPHQRRMDNPITSFHDLLVLLNPPWHASSSPLPPRTYIRSGCAWTAEGRAGPSSPLWPRRHQPGDPWSCPPRRPWDLAPPARTAGPPSPANPFPALSGNVPWPYALFPDPTPWMLTFLFHMLTQI